ncbi:MAG: hypothetical protein NWQ19_04125 [Nonlabens sp.]|nr:hypothetical protein [Nonlabens sp.]
MKQVTNEQTKQLYEFTRKHYVEYYDVQYELVDHLATGIEQQWVTHPDKPFEGALQVEFKKFGVFGFTEIIDKKLAVMQKRYNKIIWKHLASYLTSTRALIPVLIVAVLYQFIMFVPYAGQIVYGLSIASLFLFFVFSLRRGYRFRKQRETEGKKTWLLEAQLNNYGLWSSFTFIPFYIVTNFTVQLDSSYNQLSLPVLLVVLTFLVMVGVLCYIVYVEIPKKASHYLKETYPEYELIQAK